MMHRLFLCSKTNGKIVGAVCDRPRANAVRPYGVAAGFATIRRGGVSSPPDALLSILREGTEALPYGTHNEVGWEL